MPRVAILASPGIYSELEGRAGIYRLEPTQPEDIPGRAVRLAASGWGVVAVYEGAANEAPRVWAAIHDAGALQTLYMPVDPSEGGLAPALGLGGIVIARATFLAALDPSGYRLASNQWGRVILPRLRSEAACIMHRGCTACIDACPRRALEGKPPTVDASACSGCGLCTASCPASVLVMPGLTHEPLEYMLDAISRRLRGGGVLVPVCYSSYASLVEALSQGALSKSIILLPLPCSSWFTPLHAIQAVYRGYAVLAVCDRDDKACEPSPGENVLRGLPVRLSPVPPEEALSRLESLSEAEPIGESTLSMARPALVHSVASRYGLGEVELGAPGIGDVRVDQDRCMLCDACSVMCPYNALKLKVVGDRIMLVFNNSRCTACHTCEYACPYGAIRVEYKYRADRYGRETVLASDQVARCQICGAPLGSMKMMRMLEETLRKQGASELALRQLWLCPRCKLRGLAQLSDSEDSKP